MQYRYRVHFATPGTPPRDVIASTDESARHTALHAERLTGNKAKRLRVLSAERLFPVGYRAGVADQDGQGA